MRDHYLQDKDDRIRRLEQTTEVGDNEREVGPSELDRTIRDLQNSLNTEKEQSRAALARLESIRRELELAIQGKEASEAREEAHHLRIQELRDQMGRLQAEAGETQTDTTLRRLETLQRELDLAKEAKDVSEAREVEHRNRIRELQDQVERLQPIADSRRVSTEMALATLKSKQQELDLALQANQDSESREHEYRNRIEELRNQIELLQSIAANDPTSTEVEEQVEGEINNLVTIGESREQHTGLNDEGGVEPQDPTQSYPDYDSCVGDFPDERLSDFAMTRSLGTSTPQPWSYPITQYHGLESLRAELSAFDDEYASHENWLSRRDEFYQEMIVNEDDHLLWVIYKSRSGGYEYFPVLRGSDSVTDDLVGFAYFFTIDGRRCPCASSEQLLTIFKEQKALFASLTWLPNWFSGNEMRESRRVVTTKYKGPM